MRNLLQQTDIFSPRFLRFCIVGAANATVDFLGYSLLLWLALSPYFCRTLSWIIACLFSYLVNRRWTFKAADRGWAPLARFATVNIGSLCLGLVLLHGFRTAGCGDKAAFILSLPFTTAANYLGYRFWTFRRVDAKTYE